MLPEDESAKSEKNIYFPPPSPFPQFASVPHPGSLYCTHPRLSRFPNPRWRPGFQRMLTKYACRLVKWRRGVCTNDSTIPGSSLRLLEEDLGCMRDPPCSGMTINKFTMVCRCVDSYLPRFTSSHGQNVVDSRGAANDDIDSVNEDDKNNCYPVRNVWHKTVIHSPTYSNSGVTREKKRGLAHAPAALLAAEWYSVAHGLG